MVDERGTEAAAGVGGRDAHLLDVGAAVDDGAQQVGDGPVGVVDGHPRAPVGAEGLELGDRAGIVGGDLGHADRREGAAGLALDRDQRLELVAAGRADRRAHVGALLSESHSSRHAAVRCGRHGSASAVTSAADGSPGSA